MSGQDPDIWIAVLHLEYSHSGPISGFTQGKLLFRDMALCSMAITTREYGWEVLGVRPTC